VPPTRQPAFRLPLHPHVLLILASLGETPLHGYRLRQALVEQSDGTVRLDPGSLYRLIARLLDDGLLEERSAPRGADRDDERRRYYGLTKLGREVLLAETTRLEDLVATVRATKALDKPRHA